LLSNQWLPVTAISRKVVGKKFATTTLKGNMGYDHYTVPDTVLSNLLLLLSFNNRKLMFIASRAILSNFFEEQ